MKFLFRGTLFPLVFLRAIGIWIAPPPFFQPATTLTMAIEFGSHDWLELKVREWLLLLLRFAVTLEQSDRSAALAMAEQLDSLGMRWRPAAPHFFQRTTGEVCAAILMAGDRRSTLALLRHIARIDEPRLRRAFEAAVGIGPATRSPPPSERDKRRKNRGLWKGLPSR
jgi:hypothetical protein